MCVPFMLVMPAMRRSAGDDMKAHAVATRPERMSFIFYSPRESYKSESYKSDKNPYFFLTHVCSRQQAYANAAGESSS